MKTLLTVLFTFSFSLSAQAHQYIQCSHRDYWGGVVINLNADRSTFAVIEGVHLPGHQRVLKKLILDGQTELHHIFVTEDGDLVQIEKQYIDVVSRKFEVLVQIALRGFKRELKMTCFSSL